MTFEPARLLACLLQPLRPPQIILWHYDEPYHISKFTSLGNTPLACRFLTRVEMLDGPSYACWLLVRNCRDQGLLAYRSLGPFFTA